MILENLPLLERRRKGTVLHISIYIPLLPFFIGGFRPPFRGFVPFPQRCMVYQSLSSNNYILGLLTTAPSLLFPVYLRVKIAFETCKQREGNGEGSERARARARTRTRTRSIATIAEIATDSKSLVHSTLILATRQVPSQKKKQRMDRQAAVTEARKRNGEWGKGREKW